MNPKVFISHASEDKERFVIDFATKLRHKGIDAWLDKWEMSIGDSLIDKIFEEGIKDAEAIIIVLSKNSVTKPWVREELNASIVKKIEKGTKIIPIVLDECDVPESLKSTLWQSIKNLDNCDDEINKIISSIYGMNDKPKLGEIPTYANNPVEPINGLTKLDNIVLKTSCKFAMEKDDLYSIINPSTLLEFRPNLGLTQDEIEDCVEVLDSLGYFKTDKTIDCNYSYQLTAYGFKIYAMQYIPNYSEIVTKVIGLIVNENLSDNLSIIESTSLPKILVNSILINLNINGLLEIQTCLGGNISINNVSVQLKRSLKS